MAIVVEVWQVLLRLLAHLVLGVSIVVSEVAARWVLIHCDAYLSTEMIREWQQIFDFGATAVLWVLTAYCPICIALKLSERLWDGFGKHKKKRLPKKAPGRSS